MDLTVIVQILQIGIVGLAFLLAYMAFRVLKSESDKPTPSKEVLSATSKYMTFALLLSLIAVGGQGLTAYLKQSESQQRSCLLYTSDAADE